MSTSTESTTPPPEACRLCNENKEKMRNIFAKNEQGQQFIYLIKECLPLIIYRTDPLPKQICEECCRKLQNFYDFKKTSLETANKYKRHFLSSDAPSKSVQLYLACVGEKDETSSIPRQSTAATSSDDLRVPCISCKATYFDSRVNSELELCDELHKAISDSLIVTKVITDDKGARSRRRRSQAFYHELDDSLCSSLTEFTNTESSQCYEEYHSEVESYESDSDMERVKRRKLNNSQPLTVKKQPDLQVLKRIYSAESEFRYYPLSLMTLALNAVNRIIVPSHEPYEFYEKIIEPSCRYCNGKFKNSKLLALHEIDHINIELGDKVDSAQLWHESRDDAHVRNKWLNSCDEVEESEEAEAPEVEQISGESLLIPVGTELSEDNKVIAEIVLVTAKPVVNGVALSDYSKEERKAFYKSMRIGGVNKKFCSLCRYSFKDNWAIESHYFSLACYYTCRYCGMRFNKQRHRFDDHVQEHKERGDAVSSSIFAASKLNNFVPKVINPEKVKKKQEEESPRIKVKNFQRKSLQSDIVRVKEEKMDDEEAPKRAQTTNQAYFCRKCYKVFFKLDEFNVHSKNCDYNQFPQRRVSSANGETTSTGRPIRHCAREAGPYRDEICIADPAKDDKGQSFVCFVCKTPFPTIYSRNSHMRIHKNDGKKKPVEKPEKAGFAVKQEPLEPEVQIHESEQSYSSIGSVSITPISKNPNQKPTINPNIMKLVQNNPHLTIRANRSPERQPAAPSGSNAQNYDADKSYKCSSCWEAFSNKSHLYFHKKNQCEGSKYPCPFCKKRFGTEAAYSSHIFYSHPE